MFLFSRTQPILFPNSKQEKCKKYVAKLFQLTEDEELKKALLYAHRIKEQHRQHWQRFYCQIEILHDQHHQLRVLLPHSFIVLDTLNGGQERGEGLHQIQTHPICNRLPARVAEVGGLLVNAKLATKFLSDAYLLFFLSIRRFCA